MKIKTRFGLILISIIIGYATGIAYNPFLFLPIAISSFYVFIFFAILLFATRIVLRFSSPKIAEIYKDNRIKLRVIMLICAAFFYLATWTVNYYLLPHHKLHFISLTGDAGVLLLTIFLGWSLFNARKVKVIISLCIVPLCIFISLLTYPSSKNYQSDELRTSDALKSLPYLAWVPSEDNIEKMGVTLHNSNLADDGINIYVYDKDTTAYLMDMSGKIIHEWSSGVHQLHHIEMYDNGDLLGVAEDESLIKLDWNSDIKWVQKLRFHHDVAFSENRNIYALIRKDEIVIYRNLPLPILNDYIVVMSPKGKIEKSISLFEVLKDKLPDNKAGEIYRWIIRPDTLLEILNRKIIRRFAFVGDILSPAYFLHANTIEIIDRSIKGFCKKGDLLVCVRDLNLIGVLDIEKEEFVWQWGYNELLLPHHPTMLENGNILIFDNGEGRGYSRVIELNPLTKKIVWEYKDNPPEQFFSNARGANQRLKSGNTLITDSDNGRVFEVTHDGEKVWEFYTTVDEEKMKRRGIYRMMRITDTEKYPCLKEKI